MNIREIGVNMRNWVDSNNDRDYWRTLVNEALKPPGSVTYQVSGIETNLLLSQITSQNRAYYCFENSGFNFISQVFIIPDHSIRITC